MDFAIDKVTQLVIQTCLRKTLIIYFNLCKLRKFPQDMKYWIFVLARSTSENAPYVKYIKRISKIRIKFQLKIKTRTPSTNGDNFVRVTNIKAFAYSVHHYWVN